MFILESNKHIRDSRTSRQRLFEARYSVARSAAWYFNERWKNLAGKIGIILYMKTFRFEPKMIPELEVFPRSVFVSILHEFDRFTQSWLLSADFQWFLIRSYWFWYIYIYILNDFKWFSNVSLCVHRVYLLLSFVWIDGHWYILSIRVVHNVFKARRRHTAFDPNKWEPQENQRNHRKTSGNPGGTSENIRKSFAVFICWSRRTQSQKYVKNTSRTKKYVKNTIRKSKLRQKYESKVKHN